MPPTLSKRENSGTDGLTVKEGAKFLFCCPIDGNNADATFKRDQDGVPTWFVGCWGSSCRERSNYLADLAEAVGAPDGWALKADPLRWLGALIERRGRRGPAEPLPSMAKIDGWAEALRAAAEPFGWITEHRGISEDVLREYKIGWDADRGLLVFPILLGGELVAVKTRAPRPGAQMINQKGAKVRALCPEPDQGAGWALVVAGELDAFAGRSVGLPAVSVTGGVQYWRPEWTDALAGLRVVVCFDLGEGLEERRRVDKLRAAGIDAHRLRLRKLLPPGTRRKGTDLSDFLRGGGSVERLRKAAGL